MMLFKRRLKTVSASGQGDKEHIFALADFLLYLCDESRRPGIVTAKDGRYESRRFFCPLPLEEFLDGDMLRLAEEEDIFTEPEREFFSLLIRQLIYGENKERLDDVACYYLFALEAAGKLTFPLMMGAEAICSIPILDKFEGYGHECYSHMACHLGAMMGHPFCEEYLKDFGTYGYSDNCQRRIRERFPKLEGLRQERRARLEKARRLQTARFLSETESDECEGKETVPGFAELAKLSDREMQILLARLSLDTPELDFGFQTAVKYALLPESARGVRERVLLNMPCRAARNLHQRLHKTMRETSRYSGVNSYLVKREQAKILSAAHELASSGHIYAHSEREELIRTYNKEDAI